MTPTAQLCEHVGAATLTTNEACNLIEEAIREIEDENLEKELDEECDRYNKFTESNPAEHIRYNKDKGNYMLKLDDNEIASKHLQKLVKKLRENLDHKFSKNFHKFMVTKKIQYKGKKIIIYIS